MPSLKFKDKNTSKWVRVSLPGVQGQGGVAPHIGDNGNWFVGDTDTGVAAQGPIGETGQTGATGANATINGVNALTIEAGDGIEMEQVGGTLTLSATAQGSGVTVHTATIGTTWTEDEDTGVKSQNVAIDGVTASNTATVDHVFTDGTEYADFVETENQYLEFITNGYAETYDGGITFHIFGDAPTVAIPIVVEVV